MKVSQIMSTTPKQRPEDCITCAVLGTSVVTGFGYVIGERVEELSGVPMRVIFFATACETMRSVPIACSSSAQQEQCHIGLVHLYSMPIRGLTRRKRTRAPLDTESSFTQYGP